MPEQTSEVNKEGRVSRREFLKFSTLLGSLTGAAQFLAACSEAVEEVEAETATAPAAVEAEVAAEPESVVEATATAVPDEIGISPQQEEIITSLRPEQIPPLEGRLRAFERAGATVILSSQDAEAYRKEFPDTKAIISIDPERIKREYLLSPIKSADNGEYGLVLGSQDHMNYLEQISTRDNGILHELNYVEQPNENIHVYSDGEITEVMPAEVPHKPGLITIPVVSYHPNDATQLFYARFNGNGELVERVNPIERLDSSVVDYSEIEISNGQLDFQPVTKGDLDIFGEEAIARIADVEGEGTVYGELEDVEGEQRYSFLHDGVKLSIPATDVKWLSGDGVVLFNTSQDNPNQLLVRQDGEWIATNPESFSEAEFYQLPGNKRFVLTGKEIVWLDGQVKVDDETGMLTASNGETDYVWLGEKWVRAGSELNELTKAKLEVYQLETDWDGDNIIVNLGKDRIGILDQNQELVIDEVYQRSLIGLDPTIKHIDADSQNTEPVRLDGWVHWDLLQSNITPVLVDGKIGITDVTTEIQQVEVNGEMVDQEVEVKMYNLTLPQNAGKLEEGDSQIITLDNGREDNTQMVFRFKVPEGTQLVLGKKTAVTEKETAQAGGEPPTEERWVVLTYDAEGNRLRSPMPVEFSDKDIYMTELNGGSVIITSKDGQFEDAQNVLKEPNVSLEEEIKKQAAIDLGLEENDWGGVVEHARNLLKDTHEYSMRHKYEANTVKERKANDSEGNPLSSKTLKFQLTIIASTTIFNPDLGIEEAVLVGINPDLSGSDELFIVSHGSASPGGQNITPSVTVFDKTSDNNLRFDFQSYNNYSYDDFLQKTVGKAMLVGVATPHLESLDLTDPDSTFYGVHYEADDREYYQDTYNTTISYSPSLIAQLASSGSFQVLMDEEIKKLIDTDDPAQLMRLSKALGDNGLVGELLEYVDF